MPKKKLARQPAPPPKNKAIPTGGQKLPTTSPLRRKVRLPKTPTLALRGKLPRILVIILCFFASLSISYCLFLISSSIFS